MHDDSKVDVSGRNKGYADLVNSYYNLATDFYEWGWGQSFHFAIKLAGETFNSSIQRHEYYLALRLGIKPTDCVLDCGCGIGGPLRNIGRFTNARITGVTLNQYQVDRGNNLCAEANLADKCKLVQADFHKLPFEDASFDHVYAIESTCHSPDRRDVYREIFRVLKPGGKFFSYEWCLTDKYDPSNAEHRLAKKKIEEGDGLPDMCLTTVCDQAAKEVGFNMLESYDAALDPNPNGEAWYTILTPSFFHFFRIQFTYFGTMLMNIFLNFMELIRLAPKGSGDVREMLRQAQLGLVAGGEQGTFTPMYVVLAEKPL
uniref:Methyltransferase n=1 Tax=Haptolina ericina TaxID=156174 RepID=A0A7S3BGI2_9EUKA